MLLHQTMQPLLSQRLKFLLCCSHNLGYQFFFVGLQCGGGFAESMHPNQFLSCHFREVGGLIPIPQQIVIDVMEFRYVAALIDSLEGYLLGAWLISCHIECSACKICRIQ